ncbi:hypothetical protein HYZ98_02385 [Candidatus Peregrinibacteria bacterium]|nr:hypothetical protein [Candidatus Peregrinibacteria bacterium]
MSRILLIIIDVFVKWEYRIVAILLLLACGSLTILLFFFYRDSTILIPAIGGTYIEGSVGEFRPVSPWLNITNDVNRDIVSLVFAGLLKYNPATRHIEDDLATLKVSKDGRIYAVTLKPDLYWHDSTPASPHPVTADDIIFTFKTLQDPQFPISLLTQNFQGIDIQKIDERTVQFRLEEPYSFFPSNLTLGLLPARAFEGIPIQKLDQALEFGLSPIGAGPYRVRSIVQTDLSTEVTLERFARPIPPVFRLEQVVFRIFPNYATLLSDIQNLDGIRLVPHDDQGSPIVPRRLRTRNYTLPQYVALFLNTDHPALQDSHLRLGLQLGTNKQSIVEQIGESVIVDTPLLEIDVADWHYQFDERSAQGALFESRWYLPEKVRLQRLLEYREANSVGPLRIDPIVLLDTGAILTITGSLHSAPLGSTVYGLPVEIHPTLTGAWIVALPTHRGTGSINVGENLIRLNGPKENILDSFYLWRTTKIDEFKRAAEEQRLLDLFLASRAGSIPPEEQITAGSLKIDHGFLRLRSDKDILDIRINEDGNPLTLTLLTSPSPRSYSIVAEHIKKQWRTLGIDIRIDIPETLDAFQKRMLTRDYDILLFGQSLLDNLDSYPYWHSSNIQKNGISEKDLKLDAYNLSQYTSFAADALLEQIRKTMNEEERQAALGELRDVIRQEVPAIFLYSPLYTFAHQQDFLGIELKNLSLHSDRFLTLFDWYLKQERVFKTGFSWLSFPKWLFESIFTSH